MNNLYHNEIYSMFIIEKFMKLNKKIEIEKLYLLLPLVFDEKVMKKFSRITNITNLINFVTKEPRIFLKQRKLYYEYLILTTNTLQLCIENKLLKLDGNEIILLENGCIFNNYNYENSLLLNNIVDNLQKLSKLLQNDESYELYHSLRIEV